MSSINNNGPINTNANSNISEVNNTKINGKFGKNKVSIFKKIRTFISKFNLFSKKNINKSLSNRAINTQNSKNKLEQKQKFSFVNDHVDTETPYDGATISTDMDMERKFEVSNDSEGAFEYWDAEDSEPKQLDEQSLTSASDHRLAETKYSIKEPIYENLVKYSNGEDAYQNSAEPASEDHVYQNTASLFSNIDDDYVNIDSIRNQPKNDISQSSLETISNDIQSLESHLEGIKSSTFENQRLSRDTFTTFQEINRNSTNFRLEPQKTFRADNKYNDIPCPKHSSATTGNIYHANNIDMEFGNYVAAQGPYTNYKDAAIKGVSENTAHNFIAMLAEKQSPISVSLVKDTEFSTNGRNNYLPPPVGETLEIPEIKSQGKVLREKVTIKKLDSIYNQEAKLQTDIFSINGKTHIRVYDLDWEDKTGGDSARLSAISVFVEKLRSLPEVSDRKDNPVTVNCNAGVGRTGTFIVINNMTRRYLEGSGIHNTQDIVSDITDARKNRPMMVQKAEQLETLKTVSGNSIDLFKPIAEKLNIDKESLYNR